MLGWAVGSAHQSPFLWEGFLDHSWLSALRKKEEPGVDCFGDPSLLDNLSLKQVSLSCLKAYFLVRRLSIPSGSLRSPILLFRDRK